MKDKEILNLDFYDFCGCASVFMTDEDKIEWFKANCLLDEDDD